MIAIPAPRDGAQHRRCDRAVGSHGRVDGTKVIVAAGVDVLLYRLVADAGEPRGRIDPDFTRARIAVDDLILVFRAERIPLVKRHSRRGAEAGDEHVWNE